MLLPGGRSCRHMASSSSRRRRQVQQLSPYVNAFLSRDAVHSLSATMSLLQLDLEASYVLNVYTSFLFPSSSIFLVSVYKKRTGTLGRQPLPLRPIRSSHHAYCMSHIEVLIMMVRSFGVSLCNFARVEFSRPHDRIGSCIRAICFC